jgi:hypothetical protein
LRKHRLDVGQIAAEKNSSAMNLIAMKSEKSWNHCAKKKNVANSNAKKSSVKKGAPNAQSLSANGSHDALTHPISRRAYHGLL